MSFQRRHFEFIASTIKDMPDRPAAELACEAFSRELRRTNERFDESKFRKACGF